MSALPSSPPATPARGADPRRGRLARGALAGAAIAYVAILLLLPLIGIFFRAFEPGLSIVWDTLSRPEVQHAFLLTGIITLITVVVTTFFGLVVAWVLVRQRFHGRSLLNAVVDLPFALSPVTVGLAAVLLFGTGGWFADFFSAQGIQILFALPSMVLVTIFICIPFTIRELVPVLEEFGLDEEDAARTLGASIWQTFRRVTLPNIRWALLYGIALTTARSIGEIGAVLIVSGTIAGLTETATIYIFTALEERLVAEAHIVALVLALTSDPALGGHRVAPPPERKDEDRRMSMPIRGRGAHEALRVVPGRQRRLVHGRGGLDHRAPRSLRVRQEHRPPDDRRTRAARPRAGSGWATTSSRPRACRSGRSGSCSSTTPCSAT